MHVFLTGPLQVGKSTIVTKIIGRICGSVGGFRTGFGADRTFPQHGLYLYPAGGPPLWEETNVVARFSEGTAPTVLTERFDRLGAACLEGTEKATLTVMDECGRLERDAARFRRAVLARLEWEAPVLGVLRQGFPGWTADIAAHPAVQIVEVTAENRDLLPERLLTLLMKA